MRKMKRLVALVTVAMFLLSFVAPAMATTKEDSFNRLNGLNVAFGNTSGDPMYDKNYTRAEAAALMVQISGMGAAIDAAKGATKFSDVPASHWASGVINLAVGAGIIKGYPDGTYKPDANVTYAEMSAMLVQVLGYGPKLVGTWPNNVIGKAAELGLLDDLSVPNYNTAAVRGQVFIAADNALDVKVLKETKDGYEEGNTLMSEKLKATELDNQTVVGVSAVHNGIKADEVVLHGLSVNPKDGEVAADHKYEVKGTNQFLPFIGQNVKAYVNNDGKIVSVKSDEDDVYADKIKTLDLANNKIVFYAKGTKTTVDKANIAVIKNFQDGDIDTDIAEGDYVTAIVNGGKITALVKTTYANTGIVDKVENSRVYMKDEPTCSDINLKDVDMDFVQIYKNGKLAGLSDIKAGDLVQYTKGSNDEYLIVATDQSVSGKLVSVADAKGGTFKLTVGDKAIFSSDATKLDYSTDGGQNFSDATINNLSDDVIGQDVKIYCDPNGEALLVVSGAENADVATNKVVVRNITKKADVSSNTNGTTKYIKVTKTDGTDVTYVINNDDYTVTGDAGDETATLKDGATTIASPKDLVKLSFNSAGEVTKVENLNAITMVADSLNADNKVLTGADHNTYVITDKTAFIQVDAWGDDAASDPGYVDSNKKLTWDAVKSNKDTVNDSKVTFYADNKEVVLAFIQTNTSIASDDIAAVAVGGKYSTGSNVWSAKFMVNGETKVYTLADKVNDEVYSSQPVVMKLNADGEVDTIVGMGGFANVAKHLAVTVTDLKTVDDKILINDTYLVKKDAVKYFDNKGATISDATGISKDDIIDLYDVLDKDGDVVATASSDNGPDGIYDYVVIQDTL